MKEAKDLFSAQSATYAAHRPVYPDALYRFLYSHCRHFHTAWDCGTGNGQVALRLSEKFTHVHSTDISANQVNHAAQSPNITYHICRAEQTPLQDGIADLITVGTAIHWFDFGSFYEEVRRVAKPGAFFAAWCYAPSHSTPAIDDILHRFYTDIVGGYWDAERKYVDEQYRTIPFPFEEVQTPGIEIKTRWKRVHFIGYLNSWSAVQHYIEKNKHNPVALIEEELYANWKDEEEVDITFPLFIRAGYVK